MARTKKPAEERAVIHPENLQLRYKPISIHNVDYQEILLLTRRAMVERLDYLTEMVADEPDTYHLRRKLATILHDLAQLADVEARTKWTGNPRPPSVQPEVEKPEGGV